MPGMASPIPDEREQLLAYLAQQRYVIRLTAYGLTDEQARATPSASPLSVGGLIKHVAGTERNWIGMVLQQDRMSPEDYENNFRLAARRDDGERARALRRGGTRHRGGRARPRVSTIRCRYRRESPGSPTTSTPGRCAGCSST